MSYTDDYYREQAKNVPVGRVYPANSGADFHAGGTIPQEVIDKGYEGIKPYDFDLMIPKSNPVQSKKVIDFNKWFNDIVKGKTLRMWEYKRMFTPYEQQKAFSDQSEFTKEKAVFIKIKEAVTLPDGDILIGYTFDEGGKGTYMEYAKLSQIKLAYSEYDQDGYEEGDK